MDSSRAASSGLAKRPVIGTLKRYVQIGMCLVVGLVVRTLYGLRAINSPRLDGAYILAPNHTSFLDPMVVQLTTSRHITFLMDGPIFRASPIRGLFRLWGAIPIPDARVVADALKGALRAVRAGRVVGIFPEGRISRDGELQNGMAGVAMLMLRAQVPVVPVAIFGTHGILPRHASFPRPGRLLVAYGEPIPPIKNVADKKEAARILRDRVMTEISKLQERYGGRL